MNYSYVWFDLGLTLVGNQSAVFYRQMLWELRVEKDEAEIRRAFYQTDKVFMREYPHTLGGDPRYFMPWYLGILNHHLGIRLDLSLCAQTYLEKLRISQRHWEALPEAVELLKTLRKRGVGTGLISNWDLSCRAVLSRNGLDELLDAVVVSSEVGYEKPDERIFQKAFDIAGVQPQQCLYVGDNYYDDVVGAEKAGMKCILISPYGSLGIEEITHHDSVRSIAEVSRYFD